MADVEPRRAKSPRRGRGRGRGRGLGQRRPQTWEISDSDGEGAASREVGTQTSSTVREHRAAAKALRADQVLSRLAVCVDPGSDILMEALGKLGCECRIEPQHQSRSLQWSVVRPDPAPSRVPLEAWAENEQEQLLLLEPQEFLQSAMQLTQITGPPCSMPWLSPNSPIRPHLAVIGLDAYLWSHQPSSQKTWQLQKSKEAHAEVAISWLEVEEALVLLQLHANLDVLLVASWRELSQYVCAFTKALSQRPSKQYRDSWAFSFCTAGHWASGQQVTKDGSGLRGVWWRQIRQFNRVSPAVADAVVTAFPSPRLLQQALLDCSTEQERLSLLADLPVKVQRGRQPRRVGPDISRRICIFLTTTNPDLLLDLSS
ncbi:probable crossover junction endonuclease EME2 isoform X2 [Peromyscus californicus insignis]|uniref:probable crossover junction endonuclease EME2 isoform X2 n=1 Tax=Peromyscus californicus insignis TaxID=564181 RepID=UPI0022A73B47|nr:probable crossover junction endonuclease EME2 isoform X2 [Peromyscus californicus insignis]